MKFRKLTLSAFLFSFTLVCSLESSAQDSTWIRNHYYKIERYIPVRDGVKLFTSIFIPKDTTELHPILMTRTPYSCAPYGENNWPLLFKNLPSKFIMGRIIRHSLLCPY